MQGKKEYHKPEIKEWGTVTDLTQSGIIESLFGSSKSSKSSGSTGTSTTGGVPSKTSSIIP